MVFFHIFAGLIAITAGAVALAVAKGGRLHRESGAIFVYAMLVMSGLGAVLAAIKVIAGESPKLQSMNVVAGTLTFYLVVTALMTVRRRGPWSRWIDAGAMVLALAAGFFALRFALVTAGAPRGRLLGFPALPALIFGAVAMLAALGDLRLVMGRIPRGAARIVRHLWRMCLAMFIATGSFFVGQAQVLPEALRIMPLLMAPMLVVLALMLYWLARVWLGRRTKFAGSA